MTEKTDQTAEDGSELLDLVDEHDQVIGSVRRGDSHGDPRLAHRAVHVFIFNSRGEVLLQKRSKAKRVQPGKWDTSVGGHVPKGEGYEAGAKREMEEELGLRVPDPNALRFKHAYIWRSPVETEHVRTYLGEHEGPFKYNANEIDEVRFWPMEALKAALGTGVLTPNLEEELRRLKLF